MVGGDDQKVVASQGLQQLRQACVEGFECCGVSGHVAAMAVSRVEIHEVRKQETAVCEAMQLFERGIEECIVAVAARVPSGAAVGEDIVDLPDRDDIAMVTLREIEESSPGGGTE